jgi:myosin heavy subunit
MNSTSKILTLVVAIETLVLIYLVYDKFKTSEEKATLSKEIVQVKSEKSEMENELKDMYVQYESLKTNNVEINKKLEEEQLKITTMLQELKSVKQSDRLKIKQLQDETETLKSIMKDYIRQIDKLNTENIRLSSENTTIKKNYEDQKLKTETLTFLKDSLNSQVKMAKKLKAENILIQTLNLKDNETNRARKFAKVKVCFTIDDNVLAFRGTRDVYLRVAGPDGIILMNKESGMFIFQGKEIAYSSKRQVTYNGTRTDVCIFWIATEEQAIGSYSIDLFMDGNQIGEQAFSLK